MKNTVTQENPIYNIDVPDSSTATSDITPAVASAEQVDESPVVAITTLPATAGNETLSFLVKLRIGKKIE